MTRRCEVCGTDTTRDAGRCTNGRCSACHATHCTPGGNTSPGHNRRAVLQCPRCSGWVYGLAKDHRCPADRRTS